MPGPVDKTPRYSRVNPAFDGQAGGKTANPRDFEDAVEKAKSAEGRNEQSPKKKSQQPPAKPPVKKR